MNTAANIYTIARTAVQNIPTRSAWQRGVIACALDLIDDAEGAGIGLTSAEMLNGTKSRSEYSFGLICDGAIESGLCSPSELKRNLNGELSPNDYESWLDVEAHALSQAARIIERATKA